jgi:poly-gamma-glutamate capsule biosynthesis protein CapA/YwtB (metallophosphatase superfamily)
MRLNMPGFHRLFLFLLVAIFTLIACRLPAPENPPETVQELPVLFTAEPTPARLTPTISPTPTSSSVRVEPSPAATLTPSATPIPSISLLFTGIIVPARCVQAAIDERDDPDFPYEEVRGLIRRANLAVGTLNATLTDYSPRTGCVSTFVLVGGASNAPAMARAGFDVMSVATNHIKNCALSNCGDRAFFDTLENLRKAGISPVGAGANHDEAMRPVIVDLKGVRFGIVSLGQIEPMAFATEDQPGIAVLNDENLRQAIHDARREADVVIVMPHWGPEYSPNPNPYQRHFAQVAVEAGADLVVGNHTHVVQAIQEINGVPVFYGLGNFIFDQTWSQETQQSVILIVHFEGAHYRDYELIPVNVDGTGRVRVADEMEAGEILQRIQDANQRLITP